jgi:Zn-dependent protease
VFVWFRQAASGFQVRYDIAMFIQQLFDDPRYYFTVVLSVTVSIVLHELAHGWMAIRLGDRTPILLNRMTPNPLVHMGGMSLAMLFLAGIAWGSMPVSPHRLRGRYGMALVAAAGPAVNLLLALVALTALGLMLRANVSGGGAGENGRQLLWTLGVLNVLLCLFNLVPVPPLDGSKILANFSRGYATAIDDPRNQQQFLLGFLMLFFFLSKYLWEAAGNTAGSYVRLISGL